jgi:hemerythrin-like domain-containing protein
LKIQKDHNKLLSLLEKCTKKATLEDQTELKAILSQLFETTKTHIEFENHTIYPLLFKTITPDMRKYVTELLNKDTKLGFFPIQKIRACP